MNPLNVHYVLVIAGCQDPSARHDHRPRDDRQHGRSVQWQDLQPSRNQGTVQKYRYYIQLSLISVFHRDAIFPDFSGIPDFHKSKMSMKSL